jgi:hypothetical protein
MPYCAHSSTFKIPFHQAASRVTGKVKLSEIHLDGKRVNRDLAYSSLKGNSENRALM